MASEDLKALPVSERFNSWLSGRNTAQHSPQSYRVFRGMGIVIIIEINPSAFRAAGLDPARPYRELGLRVIVPIPTLRPMQADVNLIGGLDELIGQARAAAGAEDNACLPEGAVNFFMPPTGVPEFYDVATGGIELADNIVEAGFCVAIARRQLKQETAHSVAEDIRDHAEILYERLCALELLDVGDELADLDRIDERFLAGLTAPGPNARNGRPGVKRSVDFDGVEVFQVMAKPVILRHTVIERVPPFPVAPARASDKNRLPMLRSRCFAVCFALQAGRMHLCGAFYIILTLLLASEPSPFAALF